jgi:hypothetical protein
MFSRLALFSLLFLAVTWPASTQDASPSPPLSQPSDQQNQAPSLLNSDGTINWQALDEASQALSQTASEAALSASELQSKLEASLTQYTNLVLSVKMADQANQVVLKAKDQVILSLLNHNSIWIDVAAVSTGTAAGAIIGGIKGAALGVGGGLATAVIHELGRIFRLWR